MQNFEKSLAKSLENLQSFGKLHFTPGQLFYEFCRNQRPLPSLKTKTAVTLFGLTAVPAIFFNRKNPKNMFGLLSASAALFGGLAAAKKVPHTLPPPVSLTEFEENLSVYLRNNEIDGLLKIEKDVVFAENIPADLTLYGLPKLLICESDEIAQMLRANQFHLQTPCGILSLREACPLNKNFEKMLLRAEEPQIFFLHDASRQAFDLIPNLRRTLALKAEIPVRPLGLRPVHARRLHLFARRQPDLLPNNFTEINYLDESEKNWLKNGFFGGSFGGFTGSAA